MAEQETKKSANNLIAVASGKGGVGKTWFSITLAQALARRGRKVLLFDGDLGLANVDIQLGLMPDSDLGSVLAGSISLEKAVYKLDGPGSGDDKGGFDIIAGRSGTGSLARLPAPRLAKLIQDLEALSKNYDHVIMDLAAGVDHTVLDLAGLADRCLLVITDEPTSLTDAYAFVKVTRSERPEALIEVVVNAAENREGGKKTYKTLAKACGNFLGFEPDLSGVIRRDNRVREAIRKQVPLLTRSPQAEAAEDVEEIARGL